MSVAAVSSYVKTHERLILTLIAAVLIWHGIGKYESIRAAHDSVVLQQAKLATDAQLKSNAAVLAQQQADDATRAVLQSKIEAQNVQLATANAQLASSLVSRQHVDLELPLPDLAVRWNQLVPAATPTATPGGLGIDQRGAVATVVALEQIPALQSELTNETQLKANDDQLLTAANIGISDRDKQIGGLNLLIADKDKQCTAQINVVKAEAAKSKRRWFKLGFVIGFLTGAYAGHAL